MNDCYMTLSINGHIAFPDGSVPWSDELWPAYYDLANTYPSIIVGRKTFEIMEAGDDINQTQSPFILVLSHQRHPSENDRIHHLDSLESLEAFKKKETLHRLLSAAELKS